MTNEQGVYSFDGLPPGEYSLTLRRNGFLPLTLRMTLLERPDSLDLPPFELTPMPRGGCSGTWLNHTRLLRWGLGGLGGIVRLEPESGRSEGPPVRGAVVHLLGGGKVCGATRTNAKGEFLFDDLIPSLYGFRVYARGAFTWEQSGFQAKPGRVSIYRLSPMERCPTEGCDPKRKWRPMKICE